MKNIFDFKDYKRFLSYIEESRKTLERGFRSKLAEHIGCQSGYISHVLNGNAQFSLEQALKICQFLNLNHFEKKYFLLLIEYSRAGTKDLQLYFDEEMLTLREQHLNIKERVGNSRTLSESEQYIYYSSWHYAAVHVVASLPEYNDVKEISDALKISETSVSKILVFLKQVGIIIEKNNKLLSGETRIHLNQESPLIRHHHTNWRMAAIQSLTNESKTDLHYSTVSTLSQTDAERLRADMVKLIENYVEVIKPSPEEVMYGFNIDFYNLIKK